MSLPTITWDEAERLFPGCSPQWDAQAITSAPVELYINMWSGLSVRQLIGVTDLGNWYWSDYAKRFVSGIVIQPASTVLEMAVRGFVESEPGVYHWVHGRR